MYELPAYLVWGFLESGKSSFIQDTLLEQGFGEDEKTLIIACEEGEVAFDIPALEKENASVEFIENEEDLNYETLLHLHQKYQPTQVMIEYNGMWDNTKFVDEICIDQWQVVQILTTISAETFDLYYNNMRGQFVYHVTGSDLVIVNRCDENTKKYPIRGSIKSLNPMCQIVYENKNIKSNVASYITSWPDGSKGSTWTVKEGDSSTASYFTFILNSIWDKYKSSVAADLGIGADQLQQSDIKEITLTPRKISRDNGGTHPYHIDCALSIKSTKVFTAKFWVKEPGESSEYRQIDAKNYLTGNPVARTTKATIGSTKTVNGVTYVLDGWYPENAEGGAYGSTKIADNRWNNYIPSADELANGTVNFYAHYSPTTTSIKLKKLVTGSMGDKQKKFHFTISIEKENKNVTFKVGNTSKTGSATVDLANDEESTLTEIPVGADVSITEEDYSGSGYTTSYVIDNGNSALEIKANISNIQAKNDVSAHEIVFTNNKEAIPDTGITLDSLPFIALLALSIAGGIFYLFCRYKKRFV